MERGGSSLSGRHANVGGGCAVQVEVTKRTFELFLWHVIFLFQGICFCRWYWKYGDYAKKPEVGLGGDHINICPFYHFSFFPTAMLLFHPKARLLPLFLAISLNILDTIRKKQMTDFHISGWREYGAAGWAFPKVRKWNNFQGNRMMILGWYVSCNFFSLL